MGFNPAKLVPRVNELPEQQRAILTRLGRCESQKEIAAELHITTGTVKAHCRLMYMRLGIRSAGEAVRLAVAAGLV